MDRFSIAKGDIPPVPQNERSFSPVNQDFLQEKRLEILSISSSGTNFFEASWVKAMEQMTLQVTQDQLDTLHRILR